VSISAILVNDGQSLLDVMAQHSTKISGISSLSDDVLTLTFNLAMAREVFYGDCPDEDIVLAQALFLPLAVVPLTTPLRLTAGRYGQVRRIYIECLRDKAVTLPFQRAMRTATPCSRIISIDTDHSPFFLDQESWPTMYQVFS
jgi:hypothetical protein